jgi:4-aminobutyrate aminotransferase and related aminotransferases
VTRNLEKCLKLVEEDRAITSPAAKVPYYPLVVKKGRGAVIEDVDGNCYIDLLASAGAINTGHCHPRVVDAIKKQAEDLILYTHVYMYHEPIIDLTKELISISPGDYRKRVYYGLCGSDANDGAIKMARTYTKRPKILSFIRAYHGSTYGALSLSGVSLPMHRGLGPLLPEIYHVPYPDPYRPPVPGMTPDQVSDYCIDNIRTAFANHIPADEVAAVFFEPIQGDAGLVVPPAKFVKDLRALCDEHGILLFSEEVQQGFGRTGKWFGIENFDVVPDAIILGKAIASGMPLGGCVARAELMDNWEAPSHLFTAAGNPVCCAAAIATINVIRDENLLQHTVDLGAHVKARFEEMQKNYELIGDVRGIGLSVGVDLVTNRDTRERHREAAAKICYRAWEKGLLLSFFSGSVLRIQPPLVISQEQMDCAMDRIEESIEDYVQGRIPDSVLETVKGW